MPSSSIQRDNSPLRKRSRDRLSSQMRWPNGRMACNRFIRVFLAVRRGRALAARRQQAPHYASGTANGKQEMRQRLTSAKPETGKRKTDLF